MLRRVATMITVRITVAMEGSNDHLTTRLFIGTAGVPPAFPECRIAALLVFIVSCVTLLLEAGGTPAVPVKRSSGHAEVSRKNRFLAAQSRIN